MLERFHDSVVEAVRLSGQVLDAADFKTVSGMSSRSSNRIASKALAPAPKKKAEPEPAEPEPPKPEVKDHEEHKRDVGKIGRVLDSAVLGQENHAPAPYSARGLEEAQAS